MSSAKTCFFFFPLGPLTHTLTLSLPFYCVCCFMEGLDAAQIAVANRDSLSSPPVARHSIHKQITPARDLSASTEEQQAELVCILKFFLSVLFSVSVHPFFKACCSTPPSHFPPCSTSPTHSYSGFNRAGPLTPSSV